METVKEWHKTCPIEWYTTYMNDEIIDDLKQFIAATISQQTARLEDRIDGIDQRIDGIDQRLDGIDQRTDRIESKIDDLSVSVAEAIDGVNDTTDTQLKDHERRILKLEHGAA